MWLQVLHSVADNTKRQRWPESLFQAHTLLLFQNFWIRVRLFFKFENPTHVETPATIIDPTVIYPCFNLRNNRTDSCYCRNGKMTPDSGLVFHKVLTPDPSPKEKRGILPESTLLNGRPGGLEGRVSSWKTWIFDRPAGCTKGRDGGLHNRAGRWAAHQRGPALFCTPPEHPVVPHGARRKFMFSIGNTALQPVCPPFSVILVLLMAL